VVQAPINGVHRRSIPTARACSTACTHASARVAARASIRFSPFAPLTHHAGSRQTTGPQSRQPSINLPTLEELQHAIKAQEKVLMSKKTRGRAIPVP
jgi:hypothetical protein